MGEADSMELVYQLIGFPDETEWIEFKEGNSDPERIGRDISALANSAAFHGREYAYKLWGVEDSFPHRIVGTDFDPYRAKGKGGQSLGIWLKQVLSANASYEFQQIEAPNDKRLVVLKIVAALDRPVYYGGMAYIREGSSTTRLEGGSAKEAELWRRLQIGNFEAKVAEADVSLSDISSRLDIEAYFELTGVRKPAGMEDIAEALCEQGLLRTQDNGRFAITNLGALLVGRSIRTFAGLRRRPIRVVRYEGTANFNIVSDVTFDKGYALALPEAERHIMSLVPSEERQDGAFRRVQAAYPQRAIRELLSNAVIHQELSDDTSGPFVGIYDNRIEFSNPGTSLIPIDRMLNAAPKSRNAELAGILRQMDLCEEGGTGWDLIVGSCEAVHLPAPKIESGDEIGTKVILYSDRAYDRMTKGERREATYWHACLLCAQGESMSNQSLRMRFGLDDSRKNVVAISRLIKDCCEAGLIKEEDEESGARYRRYIPNWA